MNRIFSTRPGPARQYLYSVLAIAVVAGLCLSLSGLIGYRTVALVLLLAVSLLAVTFDILPVLLSAVLSALAWDLLFIPPRFTLHIHTPEDSILLAMYFIIALISGIFTFRIRRAEKAARLKEERANSVQLYNTILDSLSHELRTPIAAIIGATDNLQLNDHLSEDDRKQLVAEISKAALRLNQQVENLLNLSRLESGHIRPRNDWCDVQELVYDTVQRVEEAHPGSRIGISISEEIPFCLVDKGMLEQIVHNLLANAALHTPPGTRIEITLLLHADLLELVVEDEGPGFRDVDVKEVFHKFSRDKMRKGSGSGLGLSIVNGFAQALGGHVELENKKTGGARFTLYLPARTGPVLSEDDEQS